MSSDFVNLLNIYERDLPNSLKQIVGLKPHSNEDDSVLGCLSNVFINTYIDHTEFIHDDSQSIVITPIYYKSDYTVGDSDNFNYITTSNLLIRERYITTLNALFELIQITESIPIPSVLHDHIIKDEICQEVRDHIQNNLNDNDNKQVILHILKNLFKSFFITINAHIFNAIVRNNPTVTNTALQIHANECYNKNIITLRTEFNLNTNILNATFIKVEDQNTISLKYSGSTINYYNKIIKNNFILKIGDKEYTIINNFDITTDIEFIVKVDTSHVKNVDGAYETYYLTNYASTDLDDITIEYKSISDYKSDFDSNKKKIIRLNDNLNKQYDKYEKNNNFITYFESLYSNIDIITILFYIIFAIITFIVLFADLSLNISIFSSLIGIGVVVIFYVITIAMYDFKEKFSVAIPGATTPTTPDIPEATPEATQADQDNYTIYQSKILTSNENTYNTIKITLDMVSMRSMHRDSMRAMDLDKLKLDKGNALYENHTKNTSNILNDKKHNLLLYTLRITLLTYLSIILLVFNILYSIHPEYNILIITLTSIAIIYIIFYYMYNINKSVRSNYVNKYYPEVSDINNF